ncbi:MAG: hypothetical protein HOC34_02020 [Candidatus Magasanikbacteria bacterium]|jgi:hypothetical protein|nr:hypothetical protein [Candidatus Magasanikbacteria bacterium]MBT4221136.1 hypothetical protein [Candidatus Magasanikbacteria bacterium]MBT4350294.1 hypothetical protein [Candidatus Magasanikbacteria bacterium]MBT4541720.1 hypothetical protein [Candidatus Magasanikbacteria bacterium]MBT6253303.1 hypothetical protein [Candidatus Magasanikbacteria bacterium]
MAGDKPKGEGDPTKKGPEEVTSGYSIPMDVNMDGWQISDSGEENLFIDSDIPTVDQGDGEPQLQVEAGDVGRHEGKLLRLLEIIPEETETNGEGYIVYGKKDVINIYRREQVFTDAYNAPDFHALRKRKRIETPLKIYNGALVVEQEDGAYIGVPFEVENDEYNEEDTRKAREIGRGGGGVAYLIELPNGEKKVLKRIPFLRPEENPKNKKTTNEWRALFYFEVNNHAKYAGDNAAAIENIGFSTENGKRYSQLLEDATEGYILQEYVGETLFHRIHHDDSIRRIEQRLQEDKIQVEGIEDQWETVIEDIKGMDKRIVEEHIKISSDGGDSISLNEYIQKRAELLRDLPLKEKTLYQIEAIAYFKDIIDTLTERDPRDIRTGYYVSYREQLKRQEEFKKSITHFIQEFGILEDDFKYIESGIEGIFDVHDNGGVFCDVKARNIATKLFDFGIVREIGSKTSGRVGGTPSMIDNALFQQEEGSESAPPFDSSNDMVAIVRMCFNTFCRRHDIPELPMVNLKAFKTNEKEGNSMTSEEEWLFFHFVMFGLIGKVKNGQGEQILPEAFTKMQFMGSISSPEKFEEEIKARQDKEVFQVEVYEKRILSEFELAQETSDDWEQLRKENNRAVFKQMAKGLSQMEEGDIEKIRAVMGGFCDIRHSANHLKRIVLVQEFVRLFHENKEDLWKVADPNDPTRVEITYDDSQQASFRIAA